MPTASLLGTPDEESETRRGDTGWRDRGKCTLEAWPLPTGLGTSSVPVRKGHRLGPGWPYSTTQGREGQFTDSSQVACQAGQLLHKTQPQILRSEAGKRDGGCWVSSAQAGGQPSPLGGGRSKEQRCRETQTQGTHTGLLAPLVI